MAPSRNSRSNREFGYDERKSAPEQLRDILSMDDEEEYDEILLSIKLLTEKKLDLDFKGAAQKGKISTIEKELRDQYPSTLGATVQDSDKRLYFVYKYILYIHSRNRVYKNKNKDKEPQDVQSSVKMHTMSTRKSSTSCVSQSLAEERADTIEIASSDNENDSKLTKKMKKNKQNNHPLGSIPDPTTQTPRASHTRITPTFNQASSSKGFSQDSSSRAVAFSQRPNIISHSTGNHREIGFSSQDRGTVGPIYEFLDTCLPSMRRHLQSFLDFGCHTSEHLFSMSLWQPAMIQEFLNKLPPNRNGERLTEMEKLIVQNHLLTYFKS